MANTYYTINMKKKTEVIKNVWETNKKSRTMSKDHNLVLPYAIYYTPFFSGTSYILPYVLNSVLITHHHEKSQ